MLSSAFESARHSKSTDLVKPVQEFKDLVDNDETLKLQSECLATLATQKSSPH
ncbi:hypothetical protein [Photobacterium leiognathi]|uniref:hypothetical protein n=1 Tax=Photobacterium leiognathi TaxID=553611 RepID=UPI002732918C|nr:hypothetical protein [Photobacterium leiognathi]